MAEPHRYSVITTWSGSTGGGYDQYSRNHDSAAGDLAPWPVSADPAFRGDPQRHNPEQLLVMAASSCQLLSLLALASNADVDVVDYRDAAVGIMPEATPTSITEIRLRPVITVTATSRLDRMERLVRRAHQQCYVANSLRSTVIIETTVVVAGEHVATFTVAD